MSVLEGNFGAYNDRAFGRLATNDAVHAKYGLSTIQRRVQGTLAEQGLAVELISPAVRLLPKAVMTSIRQALWARTQEKRFITSAVTELVVLKALDFETPSRLAAGVTEGNTAKIDGRVMLGFAVESPELDAEFERIRNVILHPMGIVGDLPQFLPLAMVGDTARVPARRALDDTISTLSSANLEVVLGDSDFFDPDDGL